MKSDCSQNKLLFFLFPEPQNIGITKYFDKKNQTVALFGIRLGL